MLEGIEPAKKITAPKNFRPSVEFDGAEGSATTPGYKETPENFDDFLIDAGLDPNQVEIVPPIRTSKWQQRDGGDWLTSYKFTLRAKNSVIDLPALFAEAKKTKKPKQREAGKDKALIVAPADWQVGKVASKGNTTDLIARLEDSFDRIEEKARKGKYEQIVIIDVGDIIEGFNSKGNYQQLQSNDISPMQQVDTAATLMWRLLKRLAKYAPIKYGSVASNHCQNRFNGQQVGRPGVDDWGIVILQQLKRLSEEVGLDAEFFVPQPDEEGFVLDVFDDGYHLLGAVHGHQASRPKMIPDWWTKQAFGNNWASAASILLTGHFHHTCLLEMGTAHHGGPRWWLQASTSDNGSDWYSLRSGEVSNNAITCFELHKEQPYEGSLWRL